MKMILVKLIVCISILMGAALGINGCDVNVYINDDQSCYLDLVSDYTDIVPESEWGIKQIISTN